MGVWYFLLRITEEKTGFYLVTIFSITDWMRTYIGMYPPQQTFTLSESTRETLERGVKYFQSWQCSDAFIVNVAHITKMLYLQFVYNSLIFDSFFQCFFCWLWTGKCLLGWYVPKHFLIQHTSMKKWPDKITFFMPF